MVEGHLVDFWMAFFYLVFELAGFLSVKRKIDITHMLILTFLILILVFIGSEKFAGA